MKVGPTLIHQLNERFLRNMENELRTEALLLGTPYYVHNGLIAMLKPSKKIGYTRSQTADALRYVLQYGSSMQRIPVRPSGKQLSGMNANMFILDEFAKIDLVGLQDLIHSHTRPPVESEGALPRAEPNRGPQPRKPHIHRRK